MKACHPGRAMRMHRAEPGPTERQSRWVPGLAALARDDIEVWNDNTEVVLKWQS